MKFDKEDQRALARWAADCAAHVLPRFEQESPNDARPRAAIEAVRAWAKGELPFRQVRAAALAAHAAARTVLDNPVASAAARAAGHAAGTAHVVGHARHAAAYAGRAAGTEREAAWQQRRLPKRLRVAVEPKTARR